MTPLYVGVMLDDPKVLLRWWVGTVGELLPRPIAHHMTIQHKPTPDEVAALPIGKPVQLRVIGYADSGEIQAVVIQPHGVESMRRIPHITVATDGSTPPVKSNDLFAEGWIPVHGPVLTGRVGFVANGRDWFDPGTLGHTASVGVARWGILEQMARHIAARSLR
jgi:hypothetical protein